MKPIHISSLAMALLAAVPAAAQTFASVSSGRGVMPNDSAHAVQFTVRIENVSTGHSLQLSNGQTAPAPTAPGLWVVHRGGEPIFTTGSSDRGFGLESLAEDGDPSALAGKVAGFTGVVSSGVFTTPVGDAKPGPALPGKAFEFTVSAQPGDRLSIAMMFGQSNDLFYAFDPGGLPLFVNGKPVSGDVTLKFVLWDAGTEVNEEPGLGPSQAPRQAAPNTGPSERQAVRPVARVNDGFRYPPVAQVIRVTLTPGAVAVSTR